MIFNEDEVTNPEEEKEEEKKEGEGKEPSESSDTPVA